MREKLVSVIVPAFNAASTIAATLRSALAQTHRAIEVIVVDDGSSDGTAAIVAGLAREDGRLRLVTQSNAGVAAARNTAIAMGNGPYVAPLDADDVWHPTKIEKQLARLDAAGPDTGLVYCHARLIDHAGDVVETWPSSQRTGDVFTTLLVNNFIRSASIPLIRRHELERAGGYDPSLRARDAQGCEDLKLYLSLAERCRFERCPEFLVGYRISRNGMSSDAVRMQRSWLTVMGEVRARHPELPDRLFAWAAGNFHRWLGFNTLSHGSVGTGIAILARSVVEDPVGTLRPGMAATFVEVLGARMAARLRIKPALARIAGGLPLRRERHSRVPFAAAEPQRDDGGLPPVWESRRLAAAAALAHPQGPDRDAAMGPVAGPRMAALRR